MAAPHSIDGRTFLSYLRQSGLVGAEQVARIAQQHGKLSDGRSLARVLLGEGVLTRFQAERLLMGRTAGFHLGQYRILEQIGRGGMGRVYKAEHRTMHRLVALKVLASELLATERAVELFRHEVRAVAQLVHPNIITAFDAGEGEGRYYLVLEYIDGPNLDQLVRKQGPLSVGLASDYIRQAAAGLQCAHARGMVHRDIKPANILVQRHGQNGDDAPGLVKISDFGLARLSRPAGAPADHPRPGTILTKDNTVMGTPDYLSPEQSRDLHKTDIRSDVYSLGCTFYFLLTGSVPFPGGNAMDKLIRHATARPEPITRVRSDVPAEVLAIIDKMMAKHPAERFGTPVELSEALQPYAVSGPTPWAPGRLGTAIPFIDAQATPLESLASETDKQPLLPPSDSELPVQANAVPPDSPPPTERPIERPSPWTKERITLAAITAAAVLIGLVTVAAMVTLMLQ